MRSEPRRGTPGSGEPERAALSGGAAGPQGLLVCQLSHAGLPLPNLPIFQDKLEMYICV